MGGGFFGSGTDVPATIPGLAMWLDGRAPGYSDASGTVLAPAPSGRVRRINSPAVLANAPWLAPNDAQRPFKELSGLGMQNGSSILGISAPAGLTLPIAGCTLAGCFLNTAGYGVDVIISGTNGNVFTLQLSNSSFAGYADGGWDAGLVVPLGAKVAWCVFVTPAGLDIKLNVDGATLTSVQARAISGAVLSSLALGYAVGLGQGGSQIPGQVVGYNRVLSNAERDRLLMWLTSLVPSVPLNAPIMAVAGDSIGEGEIASLVTLAWAPQSIAFTWANPVPSFLWNASIPGDGIQNQIAIYNAKTRAIVQAANRTKPVVVIVQVMSNSILDQSGLNAAQILALLYGFCDEIRADGGKAALWTCLPRSDAAAGGGFPARRTAVNADIQVNGLAHADVLVDTTTIVGMSTIADASGPDFSADHVHPNDSGHAKIATLTNTQLAPFLS